MARAFQPAISEANNITKYMLNSPLLLLWRLRTALILMVDCSHIHLVASGKVTAAKLSGMRAMPAQNWI